MKHETDETESKVLERSAKFVTRLDVKLNSLYRRFGHWNLGSPSHIKTKDNKVEIKWANEVISSHLWLIISDDRTNYFGNFGDYIFRGSLN